AIQAQQRRTGLSPREHLGVSTAVLDAALRSVLANQDAFYHVLADSSAPTRAVLQALAACDAAGGLVPRARLRARLRRMPGGLDGRAIDRALDERPDLLVEHGDSIGIRAALVARWLRRQA
ncbi:MAG TPA: hypothetical protein VNL77_08425, partial [Roseiflexaceae bacterium]|nr:hypothetical protein [Roseiflexaceae bacterium]